MARDDDHLPPPPPGGFISDPGPAGPTRAEQMALERIAEALEGVREELRLIRRALEGGRAPAVTAEAARLAVSGRDGTACARVRCVA